MTTQNFPQKDRQNESNTALTGKCSKVKLVYENKVPYHERVKITGSRTVYNLLQSLFDFEKIDLQECFHVVYLNRNNQVVGSAKLSEGGISGTVVDIRLIAVQGLLLCASGVIISHNHPSGNLNPSEQDIQITKKVKEALQLLDMSLLDHIIVTSEGYYSFSDEGRM